MKFSKQINNIEFSSLSFQHIMHHAGNITQHIPIAQNPTRTRNTPSAPVQHMSSGSPTSRVSPNVTLSSNLISPYGSLNGYRMSAQQPSTYSAGFINNPSQLQIANMTNVMNMQSQYSQDPAALQRAAAAQQNSMYPTYPPYMINNPMRR